MEISVTADDGFELGARVYAPVGLPAKGTVLVHGATAVPQTYYARFATYLAERRVRVVTYDYRGVGASRPESLKGFEATMSDWAAHDARALHGFVRGRFGDGAIATIGHSFGGQLLGLVDEAHEVAGALLVASQLGWVGHWPAVDRLRFEAIWRVAMPALTALYGYLPGWAGLGTDLPEGVAKEWAAWCLRPGYYMGFHEEAAARLARFDRPMLLYSFSDDELAPRPAVEALVRALRGCGVGLDHRALSPLDVGAPIGHFGFFRPENTALLWQEAEEWLTAVLAGETPPKKRRVAFITEAEIAAELGF